ncbi:divergent PAP2 family protein [Desulfitobacterium sp.]|uniref:divergent PAP2 family protein n=1 Tax=Desulfitobacterium sp. TaxID=49981 RepID=UPI002C0D6819|nr:divergent PAP2 family protein [Desulfitobacterium sp.]HVJ49903.1 divergent PAP2 family protein [Desulfitobacterium sp.]
MSEGNLFITALLAAIFAQVIKIPLTYISQNRWDWRAAFSSGGMPSSHTAMMVALTSACLRNYGWNNPYFCISATVTLVIMYDAAGVRREAGNHAILLNEITSALQNVNIPDLKNIQITLSNYPLNEKIGHQPIEVLGGVLIGLIVGLKLVPSWHLLESYSRLLSYTALGVFILGVAYFVYRNYAKQEEKREQI